MRSVLRMAAFGSLCCALAIGCGDSPTAMKGAETPGAKQIKSKSHDSGKGVEGKPMPTPPAPPSMPK